MDTQSIAQAAAAKLDADRNERIAAVTELAESAKALTHSRQQLATAEQQHAQHYRAAQRLGWTDADLKGFGIESPTKSAGGRPRKAKAATTKPVSEPTNESTSNSD
ncbi:hypothetical protein ACX80E_15275 [Arthrobacter sp. TMN-49]